MQQRSTVTKVRDGHRAVVTTMSGGCGGVCYSKRTFPAGTQVERTEMGELLVRDLSGTLLERFKGRDWIDWHLESAH
jgi:hypothetical protein